MHIDDDYELEPIEPIEPSDGSALDLEDEAIDRDNEVMNEIMHDDETFRAQASAMMAQWEVDSDDHWHEASMSPARSLTPPPSPRAVFGFVTPERGHIVTTLERFMRDALSNTPEVIVTPETQGTLSAKLSRLGLTERQQVVRSVNTPANLPGSMPTTISAIASGSGPPPCSTPGSSSSWRTPTAQAVAKAKARLTKVALAIQRPGPELAPCCVAQVSIRADEARGRDKIVSKCFALMEALGALCPRWAEMHKAPQELRGQVWDIQADSFLRRLQPAGADEMRRWAERFYNWAASLSWDPLNFEPWQSALFVRDQRSRGKTGPLNAHRGPLNIHLSLNCGPITLCAGTSFG